MFRYCKFWPTKWWNCCIRYLCCIHSKSNSGEACNSSCAWRCVYQPQWQCKTGNRTYWRYQVLGYSVSVYLASHIVLQYWRFTRAQNSYCIIGMKGAPPGSAPELLSPTSALSACYRFYVNRVLPAPYNQVEAYSAGILPFTSWPHL